MREPVVGAQEGVAEVVREALHVRRQALVRHPQGPRGPRHGAQGVVNQVKKWFYLCVGLFQHTGVATRAPGVCFGQSIAHLSILVLFSAGNQPGEKIRQIAVFFLLRRLACLF